MEMSAAWLAETVEHLEGWGFASATKRDERRLEEELVFERTRYELARHDKEQFALECLAYPNGTESYWLEIIDWHGMLCTPYRLDSWKHKPDRVEFKFHIDPTTGMSLSFLLFKEMLSPLSPS